MDVNIDLARYPQFQGFDEHVYSVMEEWTVHGTAVAVVKNGQVILSKGYGWRDFERRLPVDSQTLFAIGSASKAFTSMALGILVDRGLLDWDLPVRKYLPSFALMDPFTSERITARDLLCHRSGLPGHNMMWFGSPASRRELVERLAYLQPSHDFRSVFQYQNMMFVAAGLLVEELSGQTWEEFTQREILDRLGMDSSNFSVDVSRQSENVALPYRLEAGMPTRIPFANIDTVGPAGSINSNLEDMIHWVRLHLNQGLGQSGRLISPENLAQIHKPVIPVPADFFGPIGQYPDLRFDSYALGWFIQHYRGRQLIHHGGHIDGYAALISFMPEIDAGVVFLSNDNRTLFVLPLSMNIYDLLLGLEMEPWSRRVLETLDQVGSVQEDFHADIMAGRKQHTTPSHPLSAYTGRYHHPGYGDLDIAADGDRLVMHYNGQQIALKHFHYDVFEGEYEEEGNPRWVRIQFLSSLDGEINTVTVPFEPAVDAIRFITNKFP